MNTYCFEQGKIFIVLQLLWLRTLVFAVSSKGLLQFSCLAQAMDLRSYSNLDPSTYSTLDPSTYSTLDQSTYSTSCHCIVILKILFLSVIRNPDLGKKWSQLMKGHWEANIIIPGILSSNGLSFSHIEHIILL